MTATLDERKREYGRQAEHWRLAAERLGDLEGVAPAPVWQGLEQYLGMALRQTLRGVVSRLVRSAETLAARLRAAMTGAEVESARDALLELRRAYARAETTVDFFADALVTRGAPRTASLLRACDHLAGRSMAEALAPLGHRAPAALTYLDAGLGASILKAGLRLWDGTAENPVAAIKVVRHNLFRPTSVLHEAGHQVAHILGWNEELAAALREVGGGSSQLGDLWPRWSPEIAADAFAFAHTGYASVAALHDVIDGSHAAVFQYVQGDPHPIAFLRLLLGVEMCRLSYGEGPWDALAAAWRENHALSHAPADLARLLEGSLALLPRFAAAALRRPYRAFRGQPLVAVVNPERVSPAALERLDRAAGAAAFTSPYWMWNEAIRLLALTGYRAAAGASALREAAARQERWMLRLGALDRAA